MFHLIAEAYRQNMALASMATLLAKSGWQLTGVVAN